MTVKIPYKIEPEGETEERREEIIGKATSGVLKRIQRSPSKGYDILKEYGKAMKYFLGER